MRLLRGLLIGAPLGVLAHYHYGFNDAVLADWPILGKVFFDQTVSTSPALSYGLACSALLSPHPNPPLAR